MNDGDDAMYEEEVEQVENSGKRQGVCLYLLVAFPYVPQNSLRSCLGRVYSPVGKLVGHTNACKATVNDLSAKGHVYISKEI